MMYPVLFEIFGVRIYSHGFFLLLGLPVGLAMLIYKARRRLWPRQVIPITLAALIGAVLFGCAPTPTPPVTVTLRNANGAVVGNASLTQDANGVRFSLQVKGLPPGKHGWHIHAIGKCDPPDFMSAGAHFNPENKQHGLDNPSGPHAGDSPNLEVGLDGAGSVEYVNPRVTLAGGANALFKPDGTAIIIHAQEDDQKTDPTGNSGGRIACGLILK